MIWIFVVSLTGITTLGIQAKLNHTNEEIFRDDFNSRRLNDSLWNKADGASELNDELQYFRPENAFVNNSWLYLRAEHRNFGFRNYVSGRVDTRRKFDFLYGEVEVRARVARGQGLWSSLYLLPVSCLPGRPCAANPPAVDIFDVRGDRLRETLLTVFWIQPSVTVLGKNESRAWDHTATNGIDMSLDFHVYTLVWQFNRTTWLIDGQVVFTVTGRHRVPRERMQIAMHLAVGGNYPRPPESDAVFPADFVIDYVVVREVSNDSFIVGPIHPASDNGTISNEDKKEGRVWVPIVIALGGIMTGIILALLLLYCVRKRRRCRKAKFVLRAHPPFLDLTPPGDFQLSSAYNASRESDSGHCSESSTHELSPYFRLLEIPSSQIDLSHELLGKGQFGSVWKGSVLRQDSHEKEVVAIKTVNLESGDKDQEDLQYRLFIEEMKVMTKVGRHLNIVNLLGTVTLGKPMMILEFCAHGSLLKYLQAQRGNLLDRVDPDGLLIESVPNTPRISEVAAPPPGYVSVLSFQNSLTPSTSTGSSSGSQVSTDDLIHISYQIARGLEYLAERSIIHRDLAARNVLVCENNMIKISDFGLARQRVLADYILQNDQVALPIKWMAPESIFEKSFSYKSDVWSFGIVMWEIFSLGQTPYTSVVGSGFTGHVIEFAHAVSEGLRMDRPPYAPVFIYEIMSQCWNIDKESRPSASVLRAELSTHLPNVTTEHYLRLDEPYQHYNHMNAALLNAPLTPLYSPYETMLTDFNNRPSSYLDDGTQYTTVTA